MRKQWPILLKGNGKKYLGLDCMFSNVLSMFTLYVNCNGDSRKQNECTVWISRILSATHLKYKKNAVWPANINACMSFLSSLQSWVYVKTISTCPHFKWRCAGTKSKWYVLWWVQSIIFSRVLFRQCFICWSTRLCKPKVLNHNLRTYCKMTYNQTLWYKFVIY